MAEKQRIERARSTLDKSQSRSTSMKKQREFKAEYNHSRLLRVDFDIDSAFLQF